MFFGPTIQCTVLLRQRNNCLLFTIRKYDNDSTFRTSVDRYVNDFEKLLRDIAKNDRDNIMTQTYLSSDTGKVYTMLAHAAGKLK